MSPRFPSGIKADRRSVNLIHRHHAGAMRVCVIFLPTGGAGGAARGCWRRARTRGRFYAAPDNPCEFLQGYGALRLGLDLPSPTPYMKPRRFAPLTGAGASAFPRTPLAAGGKERVMWLPPTFKLTAPAVASASVCVQKPFRDRLSVAANRRLQTNIPDHRRVRQATARPRA